MTSAQDRHVPDLAAFAHNPDETDAVALRHFEGGVVASRKADRTLVTRADTEIERTIRGRIGDRFPEHRLLGEEYGEEATDAATSWIIDPIDATHNFVCGIGVFAALLACRMEGELVLGLVSAPAMGERGDVVDPSAARLTASRVGSATRGLQASAIETVAAATPAMRSASLIVNGRRTGKSHWVESSAVRITRTRGR